MAARRPTAVTPSGRTAEPRRRGHPRDPARLAARSVRRARPRMMTPEQAVVASILLCAAGAGLTLLLARYRTLAGWLCFAVTAGTAVLIFGAVARVLTAGPSPAAPPAFGAPAPW